MGTKHIYPTWPTTIDSQGKIHIKDRQKFDQFASLYAGKEDMGITLKPFRKNRSRQEEKYYHAVPKMMIAEAMDIEPEQAHEFLCRMFLTTEESTVVNGKKIRYNRTRSTTELDDKEYRDFWTRVNRWASLPTGNDGLNYDSGLGLYIPDPNECDYSNGYF